MKENIRELSICDVERIHKSSGVTQAGLLQLLILVLETGKPM